MPAVSDGDGDEIPIGYPARRGSLTQGAVYRTLRVQPLRLSTAIDTPAPIVELSDTFFM